MILLIDVLRNKCVGCFKNIKEAMTYAKQEDIKIVSFEIYKG